MSTIQNTFSRWDKIKDAFQEYQTQHEEWAKKPMLERLKDSAVDTAYFLKGAGKSGLKLLETGVKVSPFVMGYEATKKELPEIKKMLSDWDGFISEQKKGLSQLESGFKHFTADPKAVMSKAVTNTWEGVKDKVSDETVQFLKSSSTQRAEVFGELSGDVAGYVGIGELGAFLKLGRAVQGSAVVDRMVLGGTQALSADLKISTRLSALKQVEVLEQGAMSAGSFISVKLEKIEQEVWVMRRGEMRAEKYREYWPKASLQETVEKLIGKEAKGFKNDSGKILFTNPKTQVRVVHDRGGNYFRIAKIDSQTDKLVYLNLNGKEFPKNVPLVKENKTIQTGVPEKIRQAFTHFLNKE